MRRIQDQWFAMIRCVRFHRGAFLVPKNELVTSSFLIGTREKQVLLPLPFLKGEPEGKLDDPRAGAERQDPAKIRIIDVVDGIIPIRVIEQVQDVCAKLY